MFLIVLVVVLVGAAAHVALAGGERSRERANTRAPVTLNTGVSVSVCIITGLRATINCPERDQRTFKEGSEPKEFCPLHR